MLVTGKALKRMSEAIRSWNVTQWIGWGLTLKEIADKINSIVRGWFNYYGRFYPSILRKLLQYVDLRLASWVRVKFKRFRRHMIRSIN